ncbi:hypothetical protein MSKU15_3053 [Komagataeibacter diospyri]|nr:hypothetical protein MSKU15_3053 [Komagataeibacter diospyri]
MHTLLFCPFHPEWSDVPGQGVGAIFPTGLMPFSVLQAFDCIITGASLSRITGYWCHARGYDRRAEGDNFITRLIAGYVF